MTAAHVETAVLAADAETTVDLPLIPSYPRLVRGDAFVLDASPEPESLWGVGGQSLWAKGEPLYLVGPSGVGKTTLAQQLLLARLGLRDSLLGFPVTPTETVDLYIAADRPRQAQRSLARMVDEADRSTLRDRLRVHEGPLPFDLTRKPRGLADMALEVGAECIFLDSLKDVAADLSKDETGSGVNRALQETVAAGVDVLVLHHQRKAQTGNPKPRTIADVYGSSWLTAGAGSVLLLWGDPGDLIIELRHLKQPAEEVGPLTVLHDHIRGESKLQDAVDLEEILGNATAGLTVADAAALLFATAEPDRNQIEKARRRLEKFVAKNVATRDEPVPPDPTRYFAREAA